MKNFINNNMSVVILLVFILTGIFGIPAIIGATPNKGTINWNDSINIAHFNYMDSCWTVYKTIDACYGVDNGDAFDMDYVDSADCATEEMRFGDFLVAWTQVDKDLFDFLIYRMEDGETAAYNLLSKYYPKELDTYFSNLRQKRYEKKNQCGCYLQFK